MNPPSDVTTPSLGAPPRGESPAANWHDAIDSLVSSRLALVHLESKDALGKGARRLICLGAAAIAALFAWALLVTGLVQLTHVKSGWPFHWIMLGAGFLHLVIALILAKLAKPAGQPTFSVTRAEFQKDRAWLHQLLSSKTSND